ncbi:MAG: DUF1993 domain-containing protein, partial [Rhodospirillaceae bacterium]|nr:DUF1993 domain-containing protein [Rhodospirillaceae bacterium]
LPALSATPHTAAAPAAARKIEPAVLLGARLYPDMFPFTRQVQLASDFAKGAGARLAGLEVPRYEDTETTFDELKARIGRTLDFLDGLKPAQFEGAEEREIALTIAGQPIRFKGLGYLTGFALPNFYFHAATAYDILRHCGVEIGKRDFMGSLPTL